MNQHWGVYDSENDSLLNRIFSSRKEAREYCSEISWAKVVKLNIEPEKKRQKKEKVEYFTYNNWYYKIENGKVLTYWENYKRWSVIPSCTTPKWVRENMIRVSASEIKEVIRGIRY